MFRRKAAKHKLLLIPIFAILLFYWPVLSTYFAHDDFFHFNIARADGSLFGFLKFFEILPIEVRGYGFYRQLSRETLYYFFHLLFGLNAVPFRVFAIGLQIINSIFVYKFILLHFKNRKYALFTSMFFAISAANVGVLYYLAGGIQMQLLTLFAFISLFSFRQYILKRDIWMRMVAAVAFLAGLASHELAICIPILLAIYTWSISRKDIRSTLYFIATEMLIFWYLLVAYIYVQFVAIGLPQDQDHYSFNLSPKKFINTLSWYSAWSLGLPEMLIDFVPSGLKLDPRLMRFWGGYFSIIFPSFFATLGLLIFFLFKSVKNLLKKADKRFIFLTLWFPASLGPMLFLPAHKQTYYLGFGLVGFWASIGYLVFVANKKTSKLLITIFIAVLLVLNATSIKLAEKTYPAINRGKLAQKLIADMKSQYPTLPKGATVYVKNDPDYPYIADEWGGTARQASFVLSNENAFQVLYDDPNLKVYYEGENEPKSGDYFEIEAHIPVN